MTASAALQFLPEHDVPLGGSAFGTSSRQGLSPALPDVTAYQAQTVCEMLVIGVYPEDHPAAGTSADLFGGFTFHRITCEERGYGVINFAGSTEA
jgi:hypothetical protein